MKSGDILLQQLKQLAENRNRIRYLWMLFLSPIYHSDYDWVDWTEWLKVNSN